MAATTKDGFLTIGDDPLPQHWTSDEDKQLLKKTVASYPLHIMGRVTFETHRPSSGNAKVVVLTEKDMPPNKNGVDFVHKTPEEIVSEYADFEHALLLGGGKTYRSFLDAGLVAEAYITVEPVIAGNGVPLLEFGKTLLDYGFVRTSRRAMNQTGTYLEHYSLKK